MPGAMTRLPVTILTGPLGSGKTTLLTHLLSDPRAAKTAVIVNEPGDGDDGAALLLAGGCACCTARSDLADMLRDLFRHRVLGTMADFDRVIIETAGQADPAALIQTLLGEPLTAARYRLVGVATLISALDGDAPFDIHAEVVRQVAMADRLIVTKSDLAGAPATQRLLARLGAINPLTRPVLAQSGAVDPALILDERDWLQTEETGHAPPDDGHDDGIRTIVAGYDAPLERAALIAALKDLAGSHGAALLRVRGVMHCVGVDRPLAIQGARQKIYPPEPMPAPSTSSAASRLVIVADHLAPDAVTTVLDRHLPGRS